MRPTLEEMSQRMNQASKLLGRIFNLEGELAFKEFGYYESNYSKLPDMYAVNWAMYYQGEFVEYDHIQNTSDFNIGRKIGKKMHKIVNPDLVEKSALMTESLSNCKGDEIEWHAKEKAYRNLRQIISMCSGMSYARFKESLEENFLKGVEKVLADAWNEIAEGEENPDTLVILTIFEDGQRALELAQSLYKKRGYHVIRDLARLNLEQARAKILEYVNADIMDLEE